MPDSRKDNTSDTERAELQQLSTRLSVRSSITHLAVALGASFICVIAAGITVKLGFDRNYLLSSAAGVLGLACFGVALRGFWKAQRLKTHEHTEFRRLQELRAKAGLD
ncbi:MAG TPA: hypothetical protein VGK67_26290 [Myxococcales bacterium]|jgi:hypothetical protein